MKLKKTKSAVAVLLAVMLLVSTMIVAPVTASAAKVESGSVGENYPITENQVNKVHFGFGGDNGATTEWDDVSVSYDQATGYFLSEEITVPSDVEGLTHIYYGFIAYSHWEEARYYKGNSSVADARPKLGEFNKDHWSFWDSEYNTDPNNKGDRDLLSTVVPGMKIRFRFWRFEMDCVQLVYAVFATYDPEEEAASLGTVSIEVEPEHADYTTDRAVTVTVSDIDTHIPAGDVVIPTPTFDKGQFTPNAAGTYETTDGSGNRIVKLEGTLSNFADTDVSANPYTATATATTAQDSYFDNATQTRYFFTANSATDTYYIEDTPVVEPTVENRYITVDLSVTPDTIQENQSATLTATVHYPVEMPEGWGTQYVGVTVSDNGGTRVLTPDTTSNDANNHQNVYTFILNENKYSVSDSPVRFSALATYSGTDYVASPTLTYHFDITPPAFATLTVTNPSYENENVPVGTLDVSVTPASDYNSAARTVTAVLSDISQFIDNTDDINVTMTDSEGNTLTNPAVTIGTDTVTYVYTVAANTYPNAADTVTYTGTASCDQTKTVDYTIYSFTPCSDTADTEIIIDTLDPNLTPAGYKLTLLAGLKTSIGVMNTTLAGYENVRMVVKNLVVPGGVELTGRVDGSVTYFDFDKVYPHLLVDNLECVIYATKNGVEYHGNPYIRSVRDYCYDQLQRFASDNSDYGIALKKTLVELLDYGAAVQIKKNFRTNDLANAALTPEQKAYATSSSECENIDNWNYVTRQDAVATWYGAALVFDSNIQYKLAFQTTVKPEEGWYAIARANAVNHRIDTIVSSDGETTGQIANYYLINIDDLWVSQVDSTITVTLYDKDGNAISSTMLTSIASFSARRTDLNATDRAIVDAMMKYGRAAMELSKLI